MRVARGTATGHMRAMNVRLFSLGAALVAAAGLGVALVSEHWGGLVPCALCLWERQPYRVTIVLGLVGALVPPPLGRWVLALVGLVMLASAGLGVVHVGVEWGFWPSPLPECAGTDLSGLSIVERLARMPALPGKPCDEPTYLVPGLPLSMAAMNLLYSLGLAGLAGWLAWRRVA